uniref:bifunctional phosphoserine phosphatase/homoserine phosphotransferase ThrH n=1 Tax=Desulforegula conservatrix TaxID=153026 RepID=UPI0004846625|nr:bifunctional phosphoserine phosphatase/homoserine phosphotransferase ThrH [Desulforegula conservatrix]
MNLICSDLEGVFIPEIWINVALRTGIEELKLTTRDISDYDVLMKRRLQILDANNLKLKDIMDVIAGVDPLEGAVEFVEWLRSNYQLIVVSDTFDQFAQPLMKKMGWPTIFCHTLLVDETGRVTGYKLRQADAKRKTVNALRSLDYRVVAFGDSYNDIGMLQAADQGILFSPPDNVVAEYPEFPVTRNYDELKKLILASVA